MEKDLLMVRFFMCRNHRCNVNIVSYRVNYCVVSCCGYRNMTSMKTPVAVLLLTAIATRAIQVTGKHNYDAPGKHTDFHCGS